MKRSFFAYIIKHFSNFWKGHSGDCLFDSADLI